MGRIFGILLMGLGIWIGLEIYLEGTQNAFGGVFGPHRASIEAVREVRSTPQRAGDAVKDSLALEKQRREQAMPD